MQEGCIHISLCENALITENWINSCGVGDRMKRYIEGEDRTQVTPFPECLDDDDAEDNPGEGQRGVC